MREYQRQHTRSSARVSELERRKHALEAGLEGVEVCWSEVSFQLDESFDCLFSFQRFLTLFSSLVLSSFSCSKLFEVSWEPRICLRSRTLLLVSSRFLVHLPSISPSTFRIFLVLESPEFNPRPLTFFFPAFPSSSTSLPELSSAINRRSQSTKQLLVKFVELAEKGARASGDELRERFGAEHKQVRPKYPLRLRAFLLRQNRSNKASSS